VLRLGNLECAAECRHWTLGLNVSGFIVILRWEVGAGGGGGGGGGEGELIILGILHVLY